MTWKYEDYFFAHTYLPTVNPKLPTGFTSLRARPTFNQPAYSFTGVRAYTHMLYINKPEMQKINKFAEEVKTHCTSFTGILVVDCIINVGKISVHKLPISRQRNAQQERKCRSDFHPFWSNNQQSSSRWASVIEEGEKRAQKTKTKKPRKKVPRQCDHSVIFIKTQRCFLTSPFCCSDSLTARAERAQFTAQNTHPSEGREEPHLQPDGFQPIHTMCRYTTQFNGLIPV